MADIPMNEIIVGILSYTFAFYIYKLTIKIFTVQIRLSSCIFAPGENIITATSRHSIVPRANYLLVFIDYDSSNSCHWIFASLGDQTGRCHEVLMPFQNIFCSLLGSTIGFCTKMMVDVCAEICFTENLKSNK